MAWASTFSDFNEPPNFLRGQTFGNSFGEKTVMQVHETFDITTVADLVPGITKLRVVGVVIAKGDTRHFVSKKDSGSERCVLSFTLRDSPTDFINVSCWGTEAYVNSVAEYLHIGQTVELTNACVNLKPTDGSEEKFKPWTPSLYHLAVNESKGEIKPCIDILTSGYVRLTHFPVKQHNDYYTLGDIVTNGLEMNGDVISIMAIVKQVGPVKDMKTKNGRCLKKCEVKLFDDTANDFTIIFWDEELIGIAQTWDPKENVIFAADIRVSFDEYKKAMVATAIAKTIVTVNPDTREARSLYQFAQGVVLTDLFSGSGYDSGFDDKFPNVDLKEIDKVYTVSEVEAKMASTLRDDDASTRVLGITYVVVSSLDIDGPMTSFLVKRCSRCRTKFGVDSTRCTSCSQPMSASPEMGYDIRIALSDHTGTLSNCIMGGHVADKMLGCTAEVFEKFDDQAKTELKWQFLLERCKVYFQLALPAFGKQNRPTIHVLDCSLADVDEVARLSSK